MSIEAVKTAIEYVENAINNGEHTCDIHVERVGDVKEVSFYLDGESVQDGEPVGTITIVQGKDSEDEG